MKLMIRKKDFSAMGTDISVEIGSMDTEEADQALAQVENIFRENESTFSRFSENSELSHINKNLDKETVVSEKMFEVLELCLQFHIASQGYFDPRIIESLEGIGYDRDFRSNSLDREEKRSGGSEALTGRLSEDMVLDLKKRTVFLKKRIDTTGIAKGYTVDKATKFLRKLGFESFSVDAGGDMFISGFSETGERHKINIEGIDSKSLMLELSNEGIATSGISRKQWKVGKDKVHHLINPKETGKFSKSLNTVTVVHRKTVEADVYAKTLFLMGKNKGFEFAQRRRLKALFLDENGEILWSKSMEENIWKV